MIDQQHRQPPHPVDGQIQQLARGWIDPVGVLEHHQHRPAPRLGFELAEQRLEQLLPLALRAEVEIRGGTRQRQQLAQQRDIVVIARARREQRPQFAKLGFDRVVAGEPGGAFELRDERDRARCPGGAASRNSAGAYAARFAMCSESAAVSRDLPMPGSPEISTTRPSPLFACCQRRSSSSTSSSRPTSGVVPERSASNRLTAPLSPKTRQARCGSAKPASCCGPRSSRSNNSPICCRVLAAMTRRGGCSERLQPRREIWGFADHRLFLRRALADQIADDHQPGGDPDPRLELGGFDIEATDSVDRAQSGPHRPLGIILVRSRVAEIDQHAVAHVLGDEAIEPSDDLGDRAVIGADDLTQILWVKPGRECGRADEIAEHHRQLPAFGIGWSRCISGRRRRGGGRHRSAERGNGIEQLAPVADRYNADLLEILRCQLRQHLPIDLVVAKQRFIALQAQTL